MGSTIYTVLLTAALAGSAPIALAQSKKSIPDRYITLAEAKALLPKNADSQFPLVINRAVLFQLNRYLGARQGRAHLKKSFAHMEVIRPLLERKIVRYGAPLEILAIPVIESGYRNVPQSPRGTTAGIWQFIATTARDHGLRVNDRADERLDIELQTDAAVRYLMGLKRRLQSWELAILAYNAGEYKTRAAIKRYKSRDPWTLTRMGVENAEGYLAKVMAVAFIMRNPDLIEVPGRL
jgi:membrane-bound lytic murein transglycosylase D